MTTETTATSTDKVKKPLTKKAAPHKPKVAKAVKPATLVTPVVNNTLTAVPKPKVAKVATGNKPGTGDVGYRVVTDTLVTLQVEGRTGDIGDLGEMILAGTGRTSIRALAEDLDMTHAAVYSWLSNLSVPPRQAMAMTKLEGSILEMDDFNPYVFRVPSTSKRKFKLIRTPRARNGREAALAKLEADLKASGSPKAKTKPKASVKATPKAKPKAKAKARPERREVI